MKANPHQPLIDMLHQLKKTTEELPKVMQKTMENLYSSLGDKEKEQYLNEYKKQNVEDVLKNLQSTILGMNKRK